ncbi:MAG: hypothetical protein CMJ84_01045 [Planctomycetes bacterium]|jgi:prepilin-type N-terminal cleavage/methylation domain-containing protein|nr:hypothetical protein [Planctomycetota bacterium]MDP6408339.1 prepilin-type N-terminal cleavage/methylation domain-containing protein [Planctomycetota bacterium]
MRINQRTTAAARARAGFSLIELMAVMIILAILLAFLLPRLTGMGEGVRGAATETFLRGQVTGALGSVHDELGDYPSSDWNRGDESAPNATNLGSEMLYLAFFAERFGGMNIHEDNLDNTDGDRTRRSLTIFPKSDLFELCDQWRNPIAYFHHRDYGRKDLYISYNNASGELLETLVSARQNPKTEGFYNPRGFQLISPGIDGVFNTDDDISNFSRD